MGLVLSLESVWRGRVVRGLLMSELVSKPVHKLVNKKISLLCNQITAVKFRVSYE